MLRLKARLALSNIALVCACQATPAQKSAGSALPGQLDDSTSRPTIASSDGGRDAAEHRAAPDDSQNEQRLEKDLPLLERLPDFLSVDDVVELAPAQERDTARGLIHGQLLHPGGGSELYGDYLGEYNGNELPPWYVLWFNLGPLDGFLVLYDRDGRRRDKRSFQGRSHVDYGDVLHQSQAELAAPIKEILVSAIHGVSADFLEAQSALYVYRVTPGGRFSEVLSHPISDFESYGVLEGTYDFEFSLYTNSVEIHRTFERDADPAQQPAPPRKYVYRPELGRYVPTPEARRILQEEKVRRAKKAAPLKSPP
jgi:hypothetical protein